MSERAHTAGPWRWRKDVNTGEYDLAPGVLSTSLTDGTPWGDSIDRANARLIAAAPEMLAALKVCRGLAEIAETLTGCRADDDYVADIKAKIEAAISKAEKGDTP